MAEIKFHLQTLLDAKERQLQQAGMLGQRVLAQQTELEERIRQLHDLEWEEEDATSAELAVGKEVKERYRELTEVLGAWDEENALLSSAFGSKVFFCKKKKNPLFSIHYYFLANDERHPPTHTYLPPLRSRRPLRQLHHHQ
jgi:hypothetical protein